MASDPRWAIFTDQELDQLAAALAGAYDEGFGVSDELWNELLGEFSRRGRRVPSKWNHEPVPEESATINPDGTPVLIEAVWYRYHAIHIESFGSVEEARKMLANGEDYGDLSSVGVFVEGKPRLWKDNDNLVMTEVQIGLMQGEYAKAKALSADPERREG